MEVIKCQEEIEQDHEDRDRGLEGLQDTVLGIMSLDT